MPKATKVKHDVYEHILLWQFMNSSFYETAVSGPCIWCFRTSHAPTKDATGQDPSCSKAPVETISRGGQHATLPPHEEQQAGNMVFESRRSGLCDSFKQFKQFQYDLQDDDQEEVVFDVYDLQK